MAKYIKGNQEVDAFQFGHDSFPNWFMYSDKTGVWFGVKKVWVQIEAQHGGVEEQQANTGDMIVKNSQGIIWAMDYEDFHRFYEPVRRGL